MEYEKLKQKTIGRLSNDKWYHATFLDGWNSICDLGVRADYNKDTSKDLDFGYGFYLTDTQERAETYITKLAEADALQRGLPVIIEFEMIPLTWYEDEKVNTRVFESLDDEFAEFVFKNRTENNCGEKQHPYDVIYGVMSDSYPTKLLIDYELGIIDKEDVLNGIKKNNSMKQLSLHSQILCDTILPTRAYIYNIENQDRKELDVNVYSSK